LRSGLGSRRLAIEVLSSARPSANVRHRDRQRNCSQRRSTTSANSSRTWPTASLSSPCKTLRCCSKGMRAPASKVRSFRDASPYDDGAEEFNRSPPMSCHTTGGMWC
jgi:hypothetical protein